MRTTRFREPGGHTAYGNTLPYRLGKLAKAGVLTGRWLDCGCAEGYYTVGLVERGVTHAVGVEPLDERIEGGIPPTTNVEFVVAHAERLPFSGGSFDGVLLNEVLEHVEDERAALNEIHRVLRPGGYLALFSPNRWFPFEGHGIRWSETRRIFRWPAPLIPWLPARMTQRIMNARNYWPSELRALTKESEFDIVEQGWALALFEQYPWMPLKVRRWYAERLESIERSPFARFFAVSTFILASARAGSQPGALLLGPTADTEHASGGACRPAAALTRKNFSRS